MKKPSPKIIAGGGIALAIVAEAVSKESVTARIVVNLIFLAIMAVFAVALIRAEKKPNDEARVKNEPSSNNPSPKGEG